MSEMATRLERPSYWTGVEPGPAPELPPEAPLAMPRQDFQAESAASLEATPTSPAHIRRRRLMVAAGTVVMTALVAIGPFILYSRLYGRHGFDELEALGFGIFLLLVTAIACWFCSAVAGFIVLKQGREQDDLDFAPHPPLPTARTALLMPLYNEDAEATFARLAGLDASLARLGASEAFDIFVLSDSRRADVIAAERAAYRALRPLAHSNLYMRRREDNAERKAGNIAEWVRRFGGAYEYMVVLDADSTMAGDTLLRLVDAMQRRPRIGLIQTAPTITTAGSVFARMSQFGVRMYGRVAAAGLAWWAGAEGTYWGHNAILRTRAFAEAAGLPILPGAKPFGGHILSHDVVEAALLRRAGWAVHVTAALDGSCEETPPTVLDFLQRDQRWCQGNLQHLRLVGAPGLNPVSRAQFLMGAMAYLSSPLWFLGLVIGLGLQLRNPVDWDSFWYFLHPTFSPFLVTSFLSGILLIGPKLLGCALVLGRPGECRAFGGPKAVLKSMALEIALSMALAPVMMVANTRFVFLTLRGRDAGWRPQQRDCEGLAWSDAFRAMRLQMLIGLGFSLGLVVRPDLAICFAPIVLPLLFSAPLLVFTSRRSLGDRLARAGYLVTPDEHGASAMPVVFRGAGRAASETPAREATAR